MKRTFSIILSTLTITASSFATTSTPVRANIDYEQLINESAEHIRAGEHRCLGESKDTLTAYRNQEGIEAAEKALQYRPNDWKAHFLIGTAYMNLGRLKNCYRSRIETVADPISKAADSFGSAWESKKTKKIGLRYLETLMESKKSGYKASSIRVLSFMVNNLKDELSHQEEYDAYSNLAGLHHSLLKTAPGVEQKREHYDRAKEAYEYAYKINPYQDRFTGRAELQGNLIGLKKDAEVLFILEDMRN